MKKIILLVSVLCLTGCAHVVSEVVRKESVAVDIEALFRDPDAFRGKTVILGGDIINSVNTEEGSYIEVLERPLDSRGRPKFTDVSRGRFLILYGNYLETAIYARGRQVTVAGEVLGASRKPLDEITYLYPLVRSRELHLIKPRREPRIRFGIGVYQTF